MIDTATDVDDAQLAERLRNGLVDELLAQGSIVSSEAEAAFQTVPRHLFTPGASLPTAYADDVVRTNWDEHGVAVSTVSAPWLSLSTPVVLRSEMRTRSDEPRDRQL